MHKKSKQITKAPRRKTLKTFFISVLDRAKKNTHRGNARSEDLEKELTRIDQRIQKKLAKINKEMEASDSPSVDAKIKEKLDQTTRILSDELMLLASVYHRQKDIAKIRKFLNVQRDIIKSSMVGADDDGGKDVGSLNGRISELHEVMAAERQRIKRISKAERIKFIVSLSIALISLLVSVYALTIS